MPTVFVFIPEVALREAVVEQIAAAKLAAPRLVETAAPLSGTEASGSDIVIVDAAAWQQASAVWAPRTEKPVVLLLGEAGDTESVTESFAKPFRLGHLITRLRYYLETAPLLRNSAVAFGGYRLEPQNRWVIGADGEIIRLTEKETALLALLARRTEPVARRDVLAEVWGYDERIDTHTLETHLYQLRRKFDKEGSGNEWLICEAGTYRLARGEG